MKVWLTLLLVCLLLPGTLQGASFQKLIEVNPAWRFHSHMADGLPDSTSIPSERAWISLHLQLVERSLRKTDGGRWNGKQRSNRSYCLDLLRAYRQAGNFPVNEDYPIRTPIFIDRHDNFCAVGFLLKETGHEAFARKVSAVNNLIRIRELEGQELLAWADEYGFTIDELALIQPGYPPKGVVSPIGMGVDGFVNEFYVDSIEDKLYVGGVFSKIDDSIASTNMAYLTEAGGVYTWHSMGPQTPYLGGVNAITKFEGAICRGGKGRVAAWHGNGWTHLGCLDGEVYDLQVLDGQLYACGWIRDCALNPYFTFARWNGAEWERIDGINGIINTMFVQDTTLILGGNLLYNNTQLNVIKWSPHSGFKPFGSGIANEVRDFVRFNDTLYAACRRSSSIDSINLIVRLVDDNWISLGPGPRMNSFSPFNHEVSFNTLCADGNKLMTGGSFFYDNMLWGKNTVCIKAPYFTDSAWFVLDSTVNKMVVFKKDFIVGGLFRYGSQNGAALNGICKRRAISLSAPQVALVNAFVIYPNPAQRAGTITVRNNFGADKFAILGIDGRLLSAGLLSGQSSRVLLPELSPGLYILVLANKEGRRAARSFTIE